MTTDSCVEALQIGPFKSSFVATVAAGHFDSLGGGLARISYHDEEGRGLWSLKK
jgi:hypothetical protein